MKICLLLLFIFIGMSAGLAEAALYTVYQQSWWVMPGAAVLMLLALAFVGCIELRSGGNDAVGWLVILGLAILSGYIGIRSFGIASAAGGVHLALCAVYAISGIIGAKVALKRRAA